MLAISRRESRATIPHDLSRSHGDLRARVAANRIGGLDGLGRRYVQMRAGPHQLPTQDGDEDASFLQARRDLFGRAKIGIGFEPDEVGLDLGRVEAEESKRGRARLTLTFGDYLRRLA